MSKKVTGVLAGAAVVAGLIWVFMPRDAYGPPVEPDTAGSPLFLDFPPFLLPVDELESVWALERAALTPLDEASTELMSAVRRVSFAQGLLARSLFDGNLEELEDAYNAERRSWSEFRTGDDFLALGWAAHDSFEDALREVLRLASTTDTPLDDLLSNPLDPTIHAYYESCGDFLDIAETFGLVGPLGDLLVEPQFFTLLFRRMWATRMADHWSLDTYLPAIEGREFLRWRIEQGQVEASARLRMIEQFETEHGFTEYPVEFARAVALAEGGDLASARSVLDQGNAQDSPHPIIAEALQRLDEMEAAPIE
jgi:hypothetical protein